MKRRKKLWIACAALAVVVALCAFALTYTPVPYDFLDGATVERVERASGPSMTGPTKGDTLYEYQVEGTLEEVLAIARNELTSEKGWTWHDLGNGSHLAHHPSHEVSNYFYETAARRNGQEYVRIQVFKPTSWLDGFAEWLHNR
jgi:hypothetical protein